MNASVTFELRDAPAPPAGPAPSLGIGEESPQQWTLAAHAAVKLGIDHEGWYEVSQPELLAAGLDPSIDPRTLALFVEGHAVPLLVRGDGDGTFDAGDSIGFYGRGLNAPSTATRVYWLSATNGPGLRIGMAPPAGPPVPAPNRFTDVTERRPRGVYFAALANGDDSNFFGPAITSTPISDQLKVRRLINDKSAPPLLEVGTQGVSDGPHNVTIAVAGQPVGMLVSSGRDRTSVQVPLPLTLPTTGDLEVSLRSASADDVSVVDFIRLSYPHALVSDGGLLVFTVQGGAPVTLSGFVPDDVVQVIDVTEEQKVSIVPSVGADAAGLVRLVTPGTGARTLVARSTRHLEALKSMAANHPSSWNGPQAGGDLVVIGRSDLFGALAPWKQLREAQGWSVVNVDVEDIYDEFSFGAKHPGSLRTFIARARQMWTHAPRAIVLAGDATLDPRDFLGKGDYDLVPTKLVDTASMETASDDWFTDFDGDGIADVPVGRLPARSPTELAALAAKLIAAPSFLSRETAAAAGPLVFVSDKNDARSDFRAASAAVQAMAPQPFRTIAIDRAAVSPDPNARLRDALLQGPLFLSYVGHGSQDLWAGGLLSTESVAELDGHGPGAFWSELTSLNGFFQDPDRPSLAEAVLARASGGAFGVWSSSGYTDLEGQLEMGRAFAENLMVRGMTVGEAARQAKTRTADLDVRRTWILFGDPTWRLLRVSSSTPDAGEAAGGPPQPDAGADADPVSVATPVPMTGGCSCHMTGGGSSFPWAAGLLLALLLRRRR